MEFLIENFLPVSLNHELFINSFFKYDANGAIVGLGRNHTQSLRETSFDHKNSASIQFQEQFTDLSSEQDYFLDTEKLICIKQPTI